MIPDSFFSQFYIFVFFTLGMSGCLLMVYFAFRVNRIYVDMLSDRPSVLKWYNRSRVVFVIWSMFTFCFFYSTFRSDSRYLHAFTVECWFSFVVLSMPFLLFQKIEREWNADLLTKKHRAGIHLFCFAYWLFWFNDTHNLHRLFSSVSIRLL